MSGRLPGSTILEKLLLNRSIEGDCWRWLGAHTPTGYGQLSVNGKKKAVHRLAHELFIGPIPDGLEVDHLCGVRDCLNPAHLEAVTHRVNLLRSSGPSAIAARLTHCARSHEFTPENTITSKKGTRKCRTCHLAAKARYRARKRAEAA